MEKEGRRVFERGGRGILSLFLFHNLGYLG